MFMKTGGGGGVTKFLSRKALPKKAQIIKVYLHVHILVNSKTHIVMSYLFDNKCFIKYLNG